MHCLNNLERLSINTETLIKLLKLYEFRGKDYYFEEILRSDSSKIFKQTIDKDAFYLGEIMNLNITNPRKKLIIRKGSNPKNKDEQILTNIKNIFQILNQSASRFEFSANQLLNLAIKLYEEVEKISFNFTEKEEQINLIKQRKRVSKRHDLENLIHLYSEKVKSDKFEITQLVTNFYIDLLHINAFNFSNDFIGLLTLYALLLKEKFQMLKYTSFFELVYEHLTKFNSKIVEADFNYDQGFSKTDPLNQLLIDILLEAYEKVDKLCLDKVSTFNVRKTNDIENTISKLPDIFTKEDIRRIHPLVSLSTIDRTLKRLQEEGKVRSNGKGRSATWVRLTSYDRFDLGQQKQISMFDMIFNDKTEEK